MPTAAQSIIDAAIASSLANDAGRTDIANNPTELLNVLNRKLKQVYALAGMPRDAGGMGAGDYFATSSTVTVAASAVALPAAAFRHVLVDQVGRRIMPVTRLDVVDGTAEMPPAIIIEQQKFVSAGRAGDPIAGDVLTVRFTPLPGTLTLGTHYIGATTPSDSSTTVWPDWVGDPFLVAWLARYLANKAADRDADEIQALTDDIKEAASLLGAIIGVEATRLVEDRESA